jgi:hypothetical protein
MRLNLKNFTFRKGWRNSATVRTWGKVKKLDRIWKDAVELAEDGYFAISEAVVEAVAGIKGKRKSSESQAQPAKKQKTAQSSGVDQPASEWSRGRGQVRGNQPRGRGGGHPEVMGVVRGGGGGGGGWASGSRGWSRGYPARRGRPHYF